MNELNDYVNELDIVIEEYYYEKGLQNGAAMRDFLNKRVVVIDE